jgi:site-specific recombinase XerD
MVSENIYEYEKKLKNYLDKISESKEISNSNKDLIQKYHLYLINTNIAIGTRVVQLQILKTIAVYFGEKDFEKVTKEDIEKLVYWIRTTTFGPQTVHKYLVSIKKMFKWLKGNDGEYPIEVRWIKSNVKNSQIKLPENLLTQEEVKKLICACENPRDRALLSLLNELGCRIGELLLMNIKDVEDCENYYRTTIQNSKTQPRKLKVIDSKSFIAEWLNKHSKLQGIKSPLFVGIGKKNKNERLKYDACRMLIRKISKRAGINKAINPHHWRHSTATRYANYMSYSQLCNWFGWRIGSKVPSIYIHLSGQDMDNTVDQMRGLTTTPKIEDTLTPKNCSYCGTLNKGTNDLCEKCGATLTIKGIIKKEENQKKFEQELLSRQQVIEEYVKYTQEKIRSLEKKVKI